MITTFAAKTTLGLIAAAFGNNLQTGFSLSTVGKRVYTRRSLLCPRKSFSLSALNFAEPEEKEDESLAKWEEMYQKGAEAREEQIFAMQQTAGNKADTTFVSQEYSPIVHSPVKVVTFDLDNTLWKTGPTIGAANDALSQYLSSKTKKDGSELKVPTRIEKIMGELFRADRRKYCPLVGATIPDKDDDDDDIEEWEKMLEETLKTPVALTQLRIDALCHVLETENGFSREEALSFATDAFEVWMDARYESILNHHMAPSVVETLENIRTSIIDDNGDRPVLLGAVTDGNSDPRNLEQLAPYFDFCVNAESVGVSKPDKRVYLEAIKKAIVLRPGIFSDVLPIDEIIDKDGNLVDWIDDQRLEDVVGPFWCHIGDDFLKDIVAAKDMKMRTIFAIGLVKEKLLANTTNSGDSEMDMAEFLKQVSSQTVVTLGIGADDYLANALHGEFVDEVAQDFAEIGNILLEWHKDGIDSSAINIDSAVAGREKEQLPDPGSAEAVEKDEEQNILEVIEPSSSTNVESLPVTPFANKNQEGELDFLLPRAFRIVREDCSVDIPAPLRKRDERTMKEVMGLAQREKSSGVFAFDPSDVASLNEGKKVLMIKIGGTDLEFSRDIFSAMSVEEVLGLADENPLQLSLYMTEASEQQSFDLF